jgi:hypothetical protein
MADDHRATLQYDDESFMQSTNSLFGTGMNKDSAVFSVLNFITVAIIYTIRH